MIEYPHVTPMVGVVVSKGLATLLELQTSYSFEDLCDMYEIVAVNNYNESLFYEK